jgi:hypothetical protein
VFQFLLDLLALGEITDNGQHDNVILHWQRSESNINGELANREQSGPRSGA